jgi:hypothetical protein
MPVTTSFLLSNAAKTFEASAYLSKYASHGEHDELPCGKDVLSTDGIFKNPGGDYVPCPMFQIALIDEFLGTNQIDLADPELYVKETFSSHTGLYRAQQPVDRTCVDDGCNYRAEFKSINPAQHRISILRTHPSQAPTRCCVLLVGIHLGWEGVPARMPAELRAASGRRAWPLARAKSERRHFSARPANFFV